MTHTLLLQVCKNGLTRLIFKFNFSWSDVLTKSLHSSFPSLEEFLLEYDEEQFQPNEN